MVNSICLNQVPQISNFLKAHRNIPFHFLLIIAQHDDLLNMYMFRFLVLVLVKISAKEGPKTFACKSQECLWQDWYISKVSITSGCKGASIASPCRQKRQIFAQVKMAFTTHFCGT